MSDAWFYTVIGILIYWYVADCLCFGLTQFNIGKGSLKTFLVDFFFMPVMLVKGLYKKEIKVTKSGIKMLFFYHISLFIFLLLFVFKLVVDFLVSRICALQNRIWNAYDGFIKLSGNFFTSKK